MIKSNIALISPNNSAYSETFIQQHRLNIKGNVHYYYGGKIPILSDKGYNLTNLFFKRIIYKVLFKLKFLKFNEKEILFIKSLKKNNIQTIVIEYGDIAAELFEICALKKISIVPIFHGYDASKNHILKKNFQKYIQLIDYSVKTVAVSNKIKKTLVKLGANPQKIIVSPCAPSPSFYDLTPSFESVHFFALGRFVEKKAPYLTILAFKKVVDIYPNAKLTIAGEGSLLGVCRDLVNHFNLKNNIILYGKMDREKVTEYMQNSLAFIQHSIIASDGDSEGTPVAVLEASLSGLPVISTKHAGIPDVILHEKTGFLVDEKDVEQMSKYIIKLIEDKSLCKQLGANGKEYIQENFSIRHHINVINKIIYNE